MLVVAGRCGTVYQFFFDLSRFYASEIREHLVTVVHLALILIGQIARGLDIFILTGLSQTDGCRVIVAQLGDLPHIITAIDHHLDIVVTRIRYQERITGLRVKAVIVRNIAKGIAV